MSTTRTLESIGVHNEGEALDLIDSLRRELAETNRALAKKRRAHQREIDGAVRDCMDKAKKIGKLRSSVEALVAILKEAKRPHDQCEDSWYSCPKSPDGCANDAWGDECNCGADAWNAKVDAALAQAYEGKP